LKDDLRQLGKFQFLSLHAGAKKRVLAKLIRRVYLNAADSEAIEHYERLRGYDESFPLLPDGAEGLSALYHQLMESIKPDGSTPQILPQIRRLDHVEKLTPFLPYCIYLDQIRSAYNLGSIIRTCEAFRLGSIHLSPFCPSKGHKEIAKTALGAEHHVEIFENARLEDLPRPWIALETGNNAYNYASFPFPQTGGTLIFGNEEFGVSNTILAKADYLVEIPLQGVKNSLNVANAFSIIASSIRFTHEKQLAIQERFNF
jgi:tRNA(Leu) C34 or U34 (ribose-2'-O)-methylase TrmL